MSEVTFHANATQRAFIESRAEADLFSSRKGEGKSAALCWACWYHTLRNPGAPWAMIRDTWENMQRTTLEEFFHWFPPQQGWGDYNKGERLFRWKPTEMGGGTVNFMGMDERADAAKIASMPLAGFAIDEPCPAATEGSGVDEFIFSTAFGQLRWKGAKWYAAKLAQNNSDEFHWTYRKFIDPGTGSTGTQLLPLQAAGFRLWQPPAPENEGNLPPGYYARLRREWELAGRQDLVRRFVDGQISNQVVGKQLTPEWDDRIHLAPMGLEPIRGEPLVLCWDWGLSPACIITQITPSGSWHILDALLGEDIGAYQLVREAAKPLLRSRYARFEWWHSGDPSGANRDPSDANRSPVHVVQKELGGKWRPGPKDPLDGLPALRSVLSSIGRVRVDKRRAAAIWYALRGGWHRRVSKSGVPGDIVKNEWSHPAEALAHAAPVLFPLGRLQKQKHISEPTHARYW